MGTDIPAERIPASQPQLGSARISIPLPGRPEGTRAIPAAPARAAEPAVPVLTVSAGPSLSPQATRDALPPVPAAKPTPAVPAAKPVASKTAEPLVIVVPENAKPDQAGHIPVEVYKVRTAAPVPKPGRAMMARAASPRPTMPLATQPEDRSYRLRAGDTLEDVAKKFRVTAKSLLIANGVSDARRIRSGSVIKVPGTFDLVLNDRRVAFDVTPRVENGLAIAPFRQIFEHSGGVVVYYAENREIRAANDRQEIRLQVGSKEARVNQTVVVMDREAFIDSGRTLVPITFIEKAMDLKAEYDVKTGSILLVRK
jgi:LysM repeat protein